MEFRDLRKQYQYLKKEIDSAIQQVLNSATFIGGDEVSKLEENLAEYVGVKYCITCANGTDALQLALMAWDTGMGDAVFLPDFTFFSTGEVVSALGATPVFVDVKEDTFNIDPDALEKQIEKILSEKKLHPKVIIAVDLFGQPAEYSRIRQITDKYNLLLLEDGAQGFGGAISGKKACSFGDISTTSFFPAKPLGCYGDGGAIFTDDDAWMKLLLSYKVHGKGQNKYDNVRIGMNSRLDSIQAAILNIKFPYFINYELKNVQIIARKYEGLLSGLCETPKVLDNYYSSWAQYTIKLKNPAERDGLKEYLGGRQIPTGVYYQKPMHSQRAFYDLKCNSVDYPNSNNLCSTVLSLPMSPYMTEDEVIAVAGEITGYFRKNR